MFKNRLKGYVSNHYPTFNFLQVISTWINLSRKLKLKVKLIITVKAYGVCLLHYTENQNKYLCCFLDGEKSVSLFAFLHVELTRGYLLEHDEERFSARREKVYSFIKIPQELEKFMAYGFFQCADSLLFVYTFLPLRFVMAFWSFLNRLFRKCFG